MRVALTGSHGFLGTRLAAALQGDGHDVIPVVRRATGAAGEVTWDPAAGVIDAAALDGIDAVVNLAGEPIAGSRWSASHKRKVHDSRQQGTATLCEALAKLSSPPKVLVSGSAVGVYGRDRGDDELTEVSTEGDDFLAAVCRDWEAATAPAAAAGIRVAMIRTGIVLDAEGGALPRIALPFKMGVGGRIGDGRQWMSWISSRDHIAAIRYLLANDVAGPVNLTAPEPVRNLEFTAQLSAALHRPAWLPLPRLLRRLPLGFGELVDNLLFASQRALPASLESHGFRFSQPTLGEALSAIYPQR
jgi:uncharacterized protein (TIGR01777 family)